MVVVSSVVGDDLFASSVGEVVDASFFPDGMMVLCLSWLYTLWAFLVVCCCFVG